MLGSIKTAVFDGDYYKPSFKIEGIGAQQGIINSGKVGFSPGTKFTGIIGNSPSFQKVLQSIETVAPTDASVLILGETGTGKELVARAVHRLSRRANRNYVRVNSAAIPAALLEAELFGHERGAFTGATNQRVGRFELAHQGTLFLDEIGDLPLELQPKLLRVLQEQEFERLGSSHTRKVDVRMVTATNQDLLERVEMGEFRSDLYYRLNVFPVRIPPLRERRDDIPLLANHFAQKFADKMGKAVAPIRRESLNLLIDYDYPGNVRELENIIERAVILSPDGILRIEFLESPANPQINNPFNCRTFKDFERRLILQTLSATGWLIGGLNGAAARLGLKRTTLLSKMRKLGISRRERQELTA
jgi:formate hydrogenlyase transcriptional activator